MRQRLSPGLDDEGGIILPSAVFRDIMTSVIARGGRFRFEARGLSMLPFIRDGDVLTVVQLRPTTVSLGDVVVFRRPTVDKIAVHRVVRVLQGGVSLRGDAALDADGMVPFESVIGYVAGVERNGHRVRFGFGPERRVIGLLSRHGLLIPLTIRYRRLRALMKVFR